MPYLNFMVTQIAHQLGNTTHNTVMGVPQFICTTMVAAAIIIATNTIQQHVDAVRTTVKTGMETAGYTNRLVGSQDLLNVEVAEQYNNSKKDKKT